MVWSLPVGVDFLPDVSVVFLKELLAGEVNAKPRLRLLAVLRRKEGWSLDDIAGSLDCPRMTVSDTLWRFMERGVDAAFDLPRCGRPNSLTVKQQKDFRKRLLAGPKANGFRDGFWTTRMILQLVKDSYGVVYRREHMTVVLHRMGFSSKKPRPESPHKASDDEIQRFKKKRSVWYPTGKEKATHSSAGMKSHSA